MAKFSQNTLTKVAGFNNQILAQELVYNQKSFWNLTWQNVISTGTNTPVDLTGATISATIIRRAISNLRDSRSGLDFEVVDYPLVSTITTISATTTSTNVLTALSTDELFIGQPVSFKGTVFGGVAINTTYYVKEIIDATKFTISDTRGVGPDYDPGTVLALTTAAGTMTMHRIEPLPISLTITNRDDEEGTFTIVIDDETWGVIGRNSLAVTYSGQPGDPNLGINESDPACFTGRVKISFPAVGTTPAYDNIIFLLFLITSDGVSN